MYSDIHDREAYRATISSLAGWCFLSQVAQYPSGPAEVCDDGQLSKHGQGEGALQGQICPAQQPAGFPGCTAGLDARGLVLIIHSHRSSFNFILNKPCENQSHIFRPFSEDNFDVYSGRGQGEDATLAAVVCHTPLSNLGHCRKGSTLSFSVAFQILRPGLYEVRDQDTNTHSTTFRLMFSVMSRA